jgi:nucleoside-diphosphate-sugar epimerase
MKTAIVTGANGFVGKYLVGELMAHGVETRALRLPCDAQVIPRPADVFYHLGWHGASGVFRDNPEVQLKNVALTLDAVKLACEVGCKRFISVGTVYELFADANCYTQSKTYAHYLAGKLAKSLELPFTWLRINHPVGAGIKTTQMLAAVVAKTLSGERLPFGSGDNFYDIIAVEDLAIALRLAGERELTRDLYYVGSGSPRKLREYVEAVPQILGLPNVVAFGERGNDNMRFERSAFDGSEFALETGFVPTIGFEQAVKNIAKGLNGV